MMAAWGVQSAVADLLGGKGQAMKTYMKAIGADDTGGKGGAADAKTAAGGELAKRIKGLLERGEM